MEAISINMYVNRLLASVGNCDGGGSIKPYGDVERLSPRVLSLCPRCTVIPRLTSDPANEFFG